MKLQKSVCLGLAALIIGFGPMSTRAEDGVVTPAPVVSSEMPSVSTAPIANENVTSTPEVSAPIVKDEVVTPAPETVVKDEMSVSSTANPVVKDEMPMSSTTMPAVKDTTSTPATKPMVQEETPVVEGCGCHRKINSCHNRCYSKPVCHVKKYCNSCW